MTVFWLVLSVLVIAGIVAAIAVAYFRLSSTSMTSSVAAPPKDDLDAPAETAASEQALLESTGEVQEGELESGISIDQERLVSPAKLWRVRLAKAREAFGLALTAVFRSRAIGAESWEALEEALLGADVGVKMTMELVGAAEREVSRLKISDPEGLVEIVRSEIIRILDNKDRELHRSDTPPTVYLFAGVNGSGKTTSIAKLAHRLGEEGHSVVLAAADTYRAAATEQLSIWADRVGAHLVKGSEGSDPGAVVFDAIGYARAHKTDYVLVDTAGRLHTNVNLMEELKKIARVAEKAGAPPAETLLVIDATTGQNGLTQASRFKEAVDITGIVLTKLDGSAKGGIVLAIEDELGVPVKLVGIGETASDMVPFDPHAFTDALFEDALDR